MSVPVVAVVGRPNVGKSTLFNRFIGRRAAIVEERPGVTRDRKELLCDWLGREFRLLDTGGWMPGGSALDAKVSRQSERAMADADVIVFVVDGTIGVTDEDDRVAALLRRQSRPVIVAVNKIDSQQRENLIWEFMSFGLGEPHGISALHGLRTGDLLDAVVAALPPEDEGLRRPGARDADGDEFGDGNENGLADGESEADDEVVAVALVGRPNVGKSTLFNRLIGEERSVVHDMPGTTRDTIDTIVETDIGRVRFVDTAGMRRKSKIDDGTEYYSAVRALQAVDKADVAVLVIDGGEGVTHQDQRLCERVDAAGCPILIALNKWETVDTETKEDVRRQVKDKLGFLGDVPVMGMSALSGKNVNRLLPALAEAVSAYRQRVPTRRVNEVIQKAQAEHPAPGGARVLYATQGAANPPTFTLFTNRDLHHTYLRFLENRLRDDLGLGRTPIKLRTRRRS